jgi:hypothetical protein
VPAVADYDPAYFRRAVADAQADRVFGRLPFHLFGLDFDCRHERMECAV